MPGLRRILGGQNRGGGGRAFGLDHPHQQGADLHFTGFHPGAGLLPELFTVGAEGIGKDIQHDGGVLIAILQPVGAGHLLPHLLSCRRVELFLKQLLAEVVAVLVIHIAGNGMFAVRREVDGDPHVLVFAQPAFHSPWRLKGFYNSNALFFNRFYRSGELLRLAA